MNRPPPPQKKTAGWFEVMVLSLVVLSLLMLAGLTGCKRTMNPNPDMRQRESWLFFNYSVRAPEQEVVVNPSERKAEGQYVGRTLHILVWNHFIPSVVIDQFQDKTGARVLVDTYDNTTELRERLRGGESTDVILTASFMIEQLHQEDRLVALDPKKIHNEVHLSPEYRAPAYDPKLAYCVPYLWTTAGIAYNYDALDKFPDVWADLLKPGDDQALLLHNRVSLLPVPQRAYAPALINLGYSINTDNKDEIMAAAKLISQQTDAMRFRFGRASMIEGLSTGELLMAEAYSNEAAQAQARNQSVRFCVPEDGSWVTDHCFAIPKTAKQGSTDLAEYFINFLMQPTVAADVVNYSLCASTIPETQSYIRASVRLGPTYMVPSDPAKRFLQVFTPATEELRNRLWQQLTAGMPMEQR